MGKRRLRRLMQILGVLAHADGAGWDWEIGRLWGAAPRPGRGGAANAAPENGEQSVQRRSRKPSTATENRAPGKRATEEL